MSNRQKDFQTLVDRIELLLSNFRVNEGVTKAEALNAMVFATVRLAIDESNCQWRSVAQRFRKLADRYEDWACDQERRQLVNHTGDQIH